MTSATEHPIQTARREFNDGYRAYLGRTHYLMLDLVRNPVEQPEPMPEDPQDTIDRIEQAEAAPDFTPDTDTDGDEQPV